MLSPYDNQEQTSALEFLDILMDDRAISIDGETYDIEDITDRIDDEKAKEFLEASLFGDEVQVREIYIQAIKELM